MCLQDNHPVVSLSQLSKKEVQMYTYSSNEKAFLMWSVAIGSIIGTFPFSYLYTCYGARYVLLFAGVLSAVSTALIPLAASISLHYFLVLRFIQVSQ